MGLGLVQVRLRLRMPWLQSRLHWDQEAHADQPPFNVRPVIRPERRISPWGERRERQRDGEEGERERDGEEREREMERRGRERDRWRGRERETQGEGKRQTERES